MMKRLYSILCIAAFASTIQCQTNGSDKESDIASQLVKLEILSELGKAGLEEEMAWDLENDFVVLEYLSRVYELEQVYRMDQKPDIEKKIAAEDPHIGFYLPITYHGGKEDYVGLVHPNRSVFGRTRTRTALELFDLGLLSQRTLNVVVSQLEDSTIIHESQLLNVIYAHEKWNHEYDDRKKEELDFSSQLVHLGLVNSEVIDSLNRCYREYELHGLNSILEHSRSSIFLTKSSLPYELKERYEVIFNHIKKVLPDFEYSDLSVTPEIESQGTDRRKESLVLSFNANGVLYSQSFYNRLVEKGEELRQQKELIEISSEFHQGINEFLSDVDSPVRLHYIFIRNPEIIGFYEDERFGLVVLNQEQAEFLTFHRYPISEESFAK